MTQPALFNTPRPRKPAAASWLDQLPEWLHETAATHATQPIGKTARILPCQRCGAITLHALDAAWDHVTDTRADPALLTTDLELQCILTSRTTHTLRPGHSGIQISERTKWNLAARPANRSTQPIAPAHRCHQPIGYPIPWELLYTPPKEPKELQHECPF